MKATHAAQTQLLSVQKVDLSITQVEHKLANLPAAEELRQAEVAHRAATDRLVAAQVIFDEARARVSKCEGDVAAVRDRHERETQRAGAAGVSAKQAAAMQADLAHLARRLGELEDEQLAAMEQAESAEQATEQARTAATATDAKVSVLADQLAAQQQQLQAEREQLQKQRQSAAEGLDEALLAMYDRIRARLGGVGAAPLVGRRCDGCRIDLTQGDLEAIRAAAVDEVLTCEECGRVLVRTEQSSL